MSATAFTRERKCYLIDLGADVSYADGLAAQEGFGRDIVGTGDGDALLLLEHVPVITVGRAGGWENVLAPPDVLAHARIGVVATDRGGNVTYHGPGQLVGYPLFDLTRHRPDVHWYVDRLEEALIRTLADFGVTARRFSGYAGVWVDTGAGPAKIAAIGVGVRRWITRHGFALNVAPDMGHFRLITPCGIATHGVTSLGELLPVPPDVQCVKAAVARRFAEVFDVDIVMPQTAIHNPSFAQKGAGLVAGKGDSALAG